MAFFRFELKFLVLIQVIIHLFPKHMSQTTATNNCTSAVNPIDACDKITYEEVYNILAKSENSFNIESALYPPKRPSSVRVFVNVYGHSKVKNSTPAAKYTWSISCLYAALPAKVLEFWSLGSIMVTSRTQELNITISLSCCDVTKGKLKKHIEDALAALQDLVVSPAIRDPQLNSAECITEGHQPNISSVTEHSWHIIAMLVLSVLFSTLFGPLLAFKTTIKRDELKNKKGRKSKIKKNTIDFLCLILLVILVGLYIAKEVTVHKISSDKEIDRNKRNDKEVVPWHVEAIQPFIMGVGVMVFVVTCIVCGSCGQRRHQQGHQQGHQREHAVKWKSFFFIICANLATYHFCWLLVGIMLNPIGGLVVLLLLCLVIGVLTFAFYTCMYSITYDNNTKCQSFSSCFAGSLAICGLIIVVILAGQSYNGRQTADEALKEAVMYLISIFFSWLYWKRWVNKSKKSVENGHASEDSEIEMEPLLNQDV